MNALQHLSPATHSDTPWRIGNLAGRLPNVREMKRPHGEASTYKTRIETADGGYVCDADFGYGKPCDEANALLIVRAVNCHDELLAALKDMVAIYDGLRDMLANSVIVDKLARADAAIAKAEGR